VAETRTPPTFWAADWLNCRDREVALAVAEPLKYPVLEVFTVRVEEVAGATLETVTKPDPFIDTRPEAVAEPDQL
jgi:hypothetical protein